MIETERLILRPWRESDRPAWRAMMAQPEVAYWLGGPWTDIETDAAFDRTAAAVEAEGHGVWAAERRTDHIFLGAIGIRRVSFEDHPMFGHTELAWRLTRAAWGEGYASEGAAASLAWGFETLALSEVLAFTAVSNLRSQAVMRRIGMTRDPARGFDHPTLAEDHPLRRHVVFAARTPFP